MAIYEKASDTAKKVRVVLKKEFPGIKFSVRAHNYAGGSSVNVSWIDGPTKSQVHAHTDYFTGKVFDGMTDSSSYRSYEWEGKHYSGADYIICNRQLTPEYRALINSQGQMMFGDNWQGRFLIHQSDAVEAELYKQFPYNRISEKTNRIAK